MVQQKMKESAYDSEQLFLAYWVGIRLLHSFMNLSISGLTPDFKLLPIISTLYADFGLNDAFLGELSSSEIELFLTDFTCDHFCIRII